MRYVIALDAGTTSVRAFVYELKTGKFVHGASQEIEQGFPREGWVEQDANEIYYKAAYCLNECVRFTGAEQIGGIGIANQRETVVLWDRKTGEPVCPAIVWQCRRTSDFCASLSKEAVKEIHERTGLVPDAYFSASKIRWILDNVPKSQTLLRQGRLAAGTVDSYLIFKLTNGRTFATDVTNASRTMLFNIHTLEWDETLLRIFNLPREILPEVRPCDARMGEAEIAGAYVPVAGVLGDQQAALFGQGCFDRGDGKITYGTGLFVLFNTGETCAESRRGTLCTVGYSAGGKTYYALEGSVFNAGSAVQWLRDGLGLIRTSAESESVAECAENNGGVYFVPAFTGLGAPYWDPRARGMFTGLTRSTNRAHMVRAVLESIAYSARDLIACMEEDSGINLREIKCDGGASANNFLMQFQSDLLGVGINRPSERESTALGAALMCAVSLGEIPLQEIPRLRRSERIFSPQGDREQYNKLYREYRRAVERTLL